MTTFEFNFYDNQFNHLIFINILNFFHHSIEITFLKLKLQYVIRMYIIQIANKLFWFILGTHTSGFIIGYFKLDQNNQIRNTCYKHL